MAGKPKAVAKKGRRAQRDYTEPEIQQGLLATAYFSGSPTKAARFLKEGGLEIDKGTLHRWSRQSRRADYEALRQKSSTRSATRPQSATWALQMHRWT